MARSTAEQLGVVRLRVLIVSREDQLSPVVDPRPAGLAPREIEATALGAERLTDTQTAEALFISLGTVINHVSNFLGKLQVSTRTAALAVRESIV